MHILNIASYKFITLNNLPTLRAFYLEKCTSLHLKGTILLSPEGININLAGTPEHITSFLESLRQDSRFQDMTFRESDSNTLPFKRLKVKIKKEIITFRASHIQPEHQKAPSISPLQFKKWLDENRDLLILDTRNDYEFRFGSFEKAIHLNIKDFCEFKEAAHHIPRDKPIVMFCTGGVRCEKAGLQLLNEGFNEVYQLDGGILNYFAKVGGDHYTGDCFVFDERVSLTSDLAESGKGQCTHCQGPAIHNTPSPDNILCQHCFNH